MQYRFYLSRKPKVCLTPSKSIIVREATMKLLIIVAFLSLCLTEEVLSHNTKKHNYDCPSKFIRQGHRCYFFSKQSSTWQEALFQCRSMRSNLAIIKNYNQDKQIRNVLNNKTLAPLERWLGGVYDWKEMAWKWAASGKKLGYSSFPHTEKKNENELRWHCLLVDPLLQYRWNAQPCVERKHYICQTKIRIVKKKDNQTWKRQYHVNKYNKLKKTIVDPNKSAYGYGSKSLKMNIPIAYSLNDEALAGVNKSGPRNRKRRRMNIVTYANGTIANIPINQKKQMNLDIAPQIDWITYKKKPIQLTLSVLDL